MKGNVGHLDALVRGILAFGCLVVAVGTYDRPLVSLGAVVVALALGATAILHTCPLYAIFHISTSHRGHEADRWRQPPHLS